MPQTASIWSLPVASRSLPRRLLMWVLSEPSVQSGVSAPMRSSRTDFASICPGFCISSFKIIRELVANGLGVSFLYEAVVGQDAQFGHFCCPPLTGSHELNVVYLKNTPAARYAHAFLSSHP